MHSFAYIHYCDGASFTGDAAKPVRIGDDLVYYRGKRIRDAAIDYLLHDAGMDSADEVSRLVKTELVADTQRFEPCC
jgi:hypothetical protein